MDDGLDQFEKQLAAEKAQREREVDEEEHQRKRHKHRHHHRNRDSDRDKERDKGGEKDRDEKGRRRRDGSRDRDHHRHREHRDGDRDRSRDRHRNRDDRDREHHHHHHHHRSRRHDDDDADEDRHRNKRSRHSRDDDEDSRRDKHRKRGDANEDLPIPDEEAAPAESTTMTDKPLERDSWMTAPGALDIDYVQRANKDPKPAPAAHKSFVPETESKYVLQMEPEAPRGSGEEVGYTFGDYGSDWRMKKLDAVYTTANETGRSVEDVAVSRYGSLKVFDEAREEKDEMERRRVWGVVYITVVVVVVVVGVHVRMCI